jgi:hypothetical protein
MIDLVQELLDIGYNVRHYSEYRGIFFVVGDGNKSLSALNVDIGRFSLDEPITMLGLIALPMLIILFSTSKWHGNRQSLQHRG